MKDGQLLIVERPTLSSASVVLALLAGFIASVAMVMGFAVAFVAALLLSRVPVPVVADWFRGLTSNRLIDVAAPNLYAATAVFFLGGLAWALLYGLVFDARLKGTPTRRGMTFAVIPWFVSLIVVMPLVGGGLFGVSLGAGPLPVIGNLILHAVYGGVLGAVWGSAESVIDHPGRRASSEDLEASRLSEIGAARGLAIGLVVGALIGLIGANTLASGPINPLAIIVAVALSGAAFGGFAGSLSSTR